jgi:hypothetical protein
MMPQDFLSSGFAPAAGVAAVQTFDSRTVTAIVRVERDLRELLQRCARAEAGRCDLRAEVVPALAALTDRLETLTDVVLVWHGIDRLARRGSTAVSPGSAKWLDTGTRLQGIVRA